MSREVRAAGPGLSAIDGQRQWYDPTRLVADGATSLPPPSDSSQPSNLDP
jgi:hypothetical protein